MRKIQQKKIDNRIIPENTLMLELINIAYSKVYLIHLKKLEIVENKQKKRYFKNKQREY